MLRTCLQPQIDRVEPHQRLTTFDGLTGVNQTLKQLAGDPKTQIGLDAGSHYTRESTGDVGRSTNHCGPH
ncbi:hypothetical protein EMIT0P218_30162 [Pseudomonas sp. IT-P218]